MRGTGEGVLLPPARRAAHVMGPAAAAGRGAVTVEKEETPEAVTAAAAAPAAMTATAADAATVGPWAGPPSGEWTAGRGGGAQAAGGGTPDSSEPSRLAPASLPWRLMLRLRLAGGCAAPAAAVVVLCPWWGNCSRNELPALRLHEYNIGNRTRMMKSSRSKSIL